MNEIHKTEESKTDQGWFVPSQGGLPRDYGYTGAITQDEREKLYNRRVYGVPQRRETKP